MDNSGPAFPTGLTAREVRCKGNRYDGAYVQEYEATQAGMTLRDYFASVALTGIAAHPVGPRATAGETGAESHAKWAYQVADAMIKVRQA